MLVVKELLFQWEGQTLKRGFQLATGAVEKTEPSKGRVVWRHPLGGWRSGWGGLRALVFGLRSDNGEPDV